MSPADVGLDYESVTLKSAGDNIQLAAWWIPAMKPRANMVFVHGHGSNRHSTYFRSLDFYRAMHDAQVSVLTIDLRNHGESGADENGLQWGKGESADAIAAVNWLRQQSPELPVLAFGISMGGATVINAAARGASVDGLILLDPLLDSRSVFANGGWIETGLPSAFFAPAAAAAVAFHGLPDGDESALSLATKLKLPMLLIQDPDDPVTQASYARQLANENPEVVLWEAP
ncbi:MAG: alpha/beta fold hydrolase, partial [Halieaceae bacterium]